jgi:hypothetical protein
MARPLDLLALICSLAYCVPSSAQFPEVPERCSLSAPSRNKIVSWRKVVIKRLDFDGPIHLSHSDVARIIREANQKELNADAPDWIKEFTEIDLRDAWQTLGYFKVRVTARAHPLGGNSSEERLLVTAHVEEGLQYHLKSIRFDGDSPIPEEELRTAVPIRDGELFNVELIRSGIDALTKLHNLRGYVDFTTVADTEIDDDLRPGISLGLHLDLQKQYRIGDLEIMALDPNLIARIRDSSVLGKSITLRPSRIFSTRISRSYLRAFRFRAIFMLIAGSRLEQLIWRSTFGPALKHLLARFKIITHNQNLGGAHLSTDSS